MFTNPDAKLIPIYTVEVTYANGSHEFYRNVTEMRLIGECLELEVLAHGIQKITLTCVNGASKTTQPTLMMDNDD